MTPSLLLLSWCLVGIVSYGLTLLLVALFLLFRRRPRAEANIKPASAAEGGLSPAAAISARSNR